MCLIKSFRKESKMLEKLFHLNKYSTNVYTEFFSGITTFLTMSYIIFVNPEVMSLAGMDRNAVFIATCLSAAFGSLLMAFIANLPVGMAPGMGLSAFFTFTVVKTIGCSWEKALGIVFISGIIFLFLTISGIRSWLIIGMPRSLRSAITAGIGLFLAFIALSKAGIVISNPITKVSLGNLNSHIALFSILGFLIITVLDIIQVRSAILVGILVITFLATYFEFNEFRGFFAYPPSIMPIFMKLDINGILSIDLLHVILIFILVEIFDATGTLISITRQAGLILENRSSNLNRALFADSIAISIGSILGTSSTTAFIESISGVQAGGRTGLTAFFVGLFFIAALFVSPIASSIPDYATAPALLYVACLMLRNFGKDFDKMDPIESISAILTVIVTPFTYSIANGLGFGFISFVLLKSLTGKIAQIHLATWLISILFVMRYTFLIY